MIVFSCSYAHGLAKKELSRIGRLGFLKLWHKNVARVMVRFLVISLTWKGKGSLIWKGRLVSEVAGRER